MYEFSHRFRRYPRLISHALLRRTARETCLREVLAGFRPNLAAQGRYVERYGPAHDFTPATAWWRRQRVLVRVELQLDGSLTDLPTRQALEDRHRGLLLEHGLAHLDLREITISRRRITQTIAAGVFGVRPKKCVGIKERDAHAYPREEFIPASEGSCFLAAPSPGILDNVPDEIRRKLPDDLVDELLAGARTEEAIVGSGGLLSQLTKRLVERALEVELCDHLGYGRPDRARARREAERGAGSSDCDGRSPPRAR